MADKRPLDESDISTDVEDDEPIAKRQSKQEDGAPASDQTLTRLIFVEAPLTPEEEADNWTDHDYTVLCNNPKIRVPPNHKIRMVAARAPLNVLKLIDRIDIQKDGPGSSPGWTSTPFVNILHYYLSHALDINQYDGRGGHVRPEEEAGPRLLEVLRILLASQGGIDAINGVILHPNWFMEGPGAPQILKRFLCEHGQPLPPKCEGCAHCKKP